MTNGVKTYDPSDVQIILGTTPISGFADGTFISVSMDENQFTKTVGADGNVSRSKSNNRTGTATLTLQQTSQSNDFLSALQAADELANGGAVPMMIKEIGSGSTLVFTQAAWIEKLPDVSYSKDIEDRSWTIATAQLQTFIGGNSTNSAGA